MAIREGALAGATTAQTSPAGVPLRRADPGDAAALAAFWRDRFVAVFGHLYPPEDLAQYCGEAYDPATIAAEIADPAFTHLVAQDAAGALIGAMKGGRVTLPLETTDGLWEVHRLYLAAAAMGTGLADGFIAAARQHAALVGANALVLGVYSANERAKRFYARHGFTRVGGYLFKVGETLDDEWILKAPLSRATALP